LKRQISILFIILFLPIFLWAQGNNNPDKVILTLKWKHQFQFAGYYAALEKGFYAEAGIDVELREADPAKSGIQQVLDGEANFGIANVELVNYFLQGEPIVLLASIFQHSPAVILVKESSNIFNPQDLVGKTLMLETDERGYELLGMICSEGIKPEQINMVDQSQSINDFLTNKVDAISAYITNEPFFLESFGISYRMISPKAYGIDFYSDCLFTTKSEIKNNPEMVMKFRDASIRGWEYALNNKEEIATLIITKYNTAKTFQQLIFEANAIHKLINPELVEIGHTNRGRWQSMVNFLYQYEFIDNPGNIDDFFYSADYHYDVNWTRVVTISLVSVLLLLLLGGIFLLRVRKVVARRTKDIQSLVLKLEEQNKEISSINSELILAREAAEESLKDKSTFFAGLTSELRVPVNSLMSMTEQISSKSISPQKIISLTKEIEHCSRTLNNFTKDVIAIFSIETSKERISYNAIDPADFINEFLSEKLQHFNCERRKIQVKQTSPHLSMSVLIDEEKVSRIFEILISNSLKHTPGVDIELGYYQQETDTLTFWVKDTGKGLNSTQVEQFNLFFSDPGKYFVKGVGYGLTLVKALVLLMGGDIWVTSYGNEGTTFFFKIPYIQLDIMPYNSNIIQSLDYLAPGETLGMFKDKTILIHGHHPNNYLLIRSMLEGMGCSLIFSERMDLTLNISIGYQSVDIVLMTVSVLSNPEIDAILKIREHRPQLPIIANITYEVDKKEKYIELGFTDIIQGTASRVQLISKFLEYMNPNPSA
jgi:signal transduction histidine kinase